MIPAVSCNTEGSMRISKDTAPVVVSELIYVDKLCYSNFGVQLMLKLGYFPDSVFGREKGLFLNRMT